MIKHNLILIYRQFRRYKVIFLINLTGLSVGLACVLLICLWIASEISVDRFHKRNSQLYQVMQKIPMAGEVLTTEGTPGLLSESLAQEMPEVEASTVAAYAPGARTSKGIIAFGDTQIKAADLHVGKNYFEVFSYRLIHGDKDHVLSDKYSAVISEEVAIKLFQTTENSLGKTVEWRRGKLSGLYTVSGVFEKPPANSSVQFDLLLTYEILFEKNKESFSNWGNSNPMTYLILKKGTNVNQFNEKIKNYVRLKYRSLNKTDADWIGALFIQQYSDRYLYNHFENGFPAGGRISQVRHFAIIAIFILLIACINFMNLSTAKATIRMKEIGVKKAIGASRKVLISQHFGESMVLTLLALIIAILIVALLLPEFNRITGKEMTLYFDLQIIIALISIASLTGSISGSYPALYLSGVKPLLVLKGNLPGSTNEQWIRKGLVVFQFTISIILIVSVMVVKKQLEFIYTKNLGFEKENIIRFVNEGRLPERLETFLSDVRKIPSVINASSFGNDITDSNSFTSGLDWEGKTSNGKILFGHLEVDFELIELLHLQMKEGRAFSKEFNMEESKIIFNEAAIAAMGLKDPMGKTVKLWGHEKQIIGVVKNFHFESLYESVQPCFLRLSPGSSNILIKIKAGMEREALSEVQKLYHMYNDGLPFEYRFLNEEYQKVYQSEQRFADLLHYFAGMAIIISCLGLFGLAKFTSERRLKEISIRKILGSTDLDLVYLMSGGFTKLVLVAIIAALPISYWLIMHWLNSFAFKIDLTVWYFISAGAVALFISWVTIAVQTIKAARANPVHNLRIE